VYIFFATSVVGFSITTIASAPQELGKEQMGGIEVEVSVRGMTG
jgi:hypothetical protein